MQEHYYDEETRRGFIEYRLWNVRRTLSPSQKKYKTKALDSGKTTPVSPNINLLSQEELDSKVCLINLYKFTFREDLNIIFLYN